MSFSEIVNEAIRGTPSGHNSQPWKLEIKKDEEEEKILMIYPDFQKKLPIVDPEDKELYISLGCLIKAIEVSASKFGFKIEYDFEPKVDKENTVVVNTKITFKKESNIEQSELYPALEKRQTARGCFDNKIIESSTLDNLKNIPKQDHVNIYMYEKGSDNFNKFREYVMEGNRNQMNDEKFKVELINFMRFNKKEVEKNQDGLSYEAYGMPSFPAFISSRIMRLFLKEKPQNKDDGKKIDSASHLVLFTIKESDDMAKKIEAWLRLGITLETFLLKLHTIEGLVVAFNNQPCEVEEIRKKVQSEVFGGESGNNEIPCILIRIGLGSLSSFKSPRKSFESVLINSS